MIDNQAAVKCAIMAEVKIIDESHKVSDKRRNGKLRREVSNDETGKKIPRSKLACINPDFFAHVGDGLYSKVAAEGESASHR